MKRITANGNLGAPTELDGVYFTPNSLLTAFELERECEISCCVLISLLAEIFQWFNWGFRHKRYSWAIRCAVVGS